MMYRCDECGELFEEPKNIQETYPYGDGLADDPRNVSPCCHESYSEATPCKICGEYAEDDEMYSDVCEYCIEDGVRKYFMEYLDGCKRYVKMDFYGIHGESYAFDHLAMLSILEHEYKTNSELNDFDRQSEFIHDSDPDHFAEWLLEKKEAERNAVQNAASQDS